MPEIPDKLAEIIARKREEVELLMPRAGHLRGASDPPWTGGRTGSG